MGKKVRSARGEMVDFDLMLIQQQLAATPIRADVQARQDFIERRLRRHIRKVAKPAPKLHKEGTSDPKLPGTEELSEIQQLMEAAPKDIKKPTTRRQKARPEVKTEEDNTETKE